MSYEGYEPMSRNGHPRSNQCWGNLMIISRENSVNLRGMRTVPYGSHPRVSFRKKPWGPSQGRDRLGDLQIRTLCEGQMTCVIWESMGHLRVASHSVSLLLH